MASGEKGPAIAYCIICHHPILFTFTTIPVTQFGPAPDPFTFIKKHYRLFHPNIFDMRYRR